MSEFRPPFLFKNPHLQTILPNLFRKRNFPTTRETLDTPDGDFIHLDWKTEGNKTVTVVIHGLESSANQNYMQAMGDCLLTHGSDVVLYNLRSCSGEPNRLFRSYFGGDSLDLDHVLKHVQGKKYEQINVVGFSFGGNITLKYLGEFGENARCDKAVAISVPIDLGASSDHFNAPSNRFYLKRFLDKLKGKLLEKEPLFSDQLNRDTINSFQTFEEYDDYYTAPAHGFKSGRDYYEKCSSVNYLSGIRKPALLINAKDDPFLTKECFPHHIAKENPFFHLETPEHGGHVGFFNFPFPEFFWHELRAVSFLGL